MSRIFPAVPPAQAMDPIDPGASLAAQIADGLVEGAINAAVRNADKLGTLATGLAQACADGLRTISTPTATTAAQPTEAPQVAAELREAINSGAVPG